MNPDSGKKTVELKKPQPANNVGKTVGPIEDLERYVHPEWWKRIFNANYLKTDADVVEDHGITKKEIELYLNILNAEKDKKWLDLCCGQGRHVIELARAGFSNIEGFDRSHYLVQKARVTARKENFNVRFKEGDARKVSHPDCNFDIVTMLGNSFGYFETVNDDLSVLKEIRRILRPEGILLIDVSDGEHIRHNFQPRSWEWIDKKHFVCRERSLSADQERLISREVITHVGKGVIVDQFYAERLYTKDTLKNLLEEMGFSNIKFHMQIMTSTQRNQDLGMMEKRIVMTATVLKEWPKKTIRKKENLKQIAVLMGDPRKSDPVKPSAVFDSDDFYTIDQLKGALKKLNEYNFIYLNNHDTIVSDLLKHKGKVDYIFNLCDEGYSNDARKELHVPSLMEIFGIPYSGSGPQCLAYCYDKSLVRGIAREMGIAVPKAFLIKPEDNVYDLTFPFPVLVKPNFGDSSFGITQNSYATNIEQLVNAIQRLRNEVGYEKPLLVEEFLEGKDLTVGIIGNPLESYTFLPIIEKDYSSLPDDLPKICGYEAKWMPDSPYGQLRSIPVNLPNDIEKYLEDCCLKLFERLECMDYARIDWRLDRDGFPRLLEVNPNPGWCWDGHLAEMAKLAGMSYSDMIGEILKASERRLKIG